MNYPTVCLLVHLLALLAPANGETVEENAALSIADTESYIYCGNELEHVVEATSPTSFNVIQIPPNLPKRTDVTTKLSIIQMREISDDQVFSVTAMISFTWVEKRVEILDSACWNSSAQFTVATTRALAWYPLWTISNGHGTVLLKDAWQYNPSIVYGNGQIIWKVSINFLTECPLNVKQFPFDVQECSIDITSPQYDTLTVKYLADKKAVTADSATSLQSPLWQIIGQGTEEVSSVYPSISFKFLIQRRPGFYNVALILPIVVINIITAYTFLLPAYQEEKTTTAGAAVVGYFFIEVMFFDYVPVSSDNIPGLVIFLTFHAFLAVIAYLTESRLIRFAEEKNDEQEQAPLRSFGLTKKNNKIVPIDHVEEDRKRGPFDGLSPEYVNDWCLLGYLGIVLLTYVIFFIYLPVKAQATRDYLMSTTYSSVTIETND